MTIEKNTNYMLPIESKCMFNNIKFTYILPTGKLVYFSIRF